jgi:hypothetical protein
LVFGRLYLVTATVGKTDAENDGFSGRLLMEDCRESMDFYEEDWNFYEEKS